MLQRIPDRVDPWRLAEQGKTLEGRIKLDSLPRLAPLLAFADGEAAFVLRFGRDKRNRPILGLRVTTELVLQCQRCLDSMVQEVDSAIMLALVQGDMEAEQLPEELEPLLSEDGEYLDIAELIEDELLLGIPSSPRHKEQNCNRRADAKAHRLPEAEQKEDNPFAILAGLHVGKNDH
ncbi:YceD family protein [Thiolapillus sp.]